METFQNISLDKKCRICAMDIFDETSGISIFSDIFLEEKIKKYLYISISQSDRLPKYICGGCFIKLEGIHRFASLALKTEENFLTYLSRMKYNEERKQETVVDTTAEVINLTSQGTTIIEIPQSNKSYNRKLNIRPYRTQKIRNPRHVDHITLEQIINDKIAKNFRSQTCEIIPIKTPQINNINPILPYDDLKLGNFIKDLELLRLILKALQWDNELEEATALLTNDYNFPSMERLKNTSFRELLSNPQLLKNTDLVQLIKTYIGQEAFSHINNSLKMNTAELTKIKNYKNDMNMYCNVNDKITQMEVRVDPALFLPYDEEESAQRVNSDEIIVSVKKSLENNKHEKQQPQYYVKERNHLCTVCPERFVSNVQLQEHIVKHLLKPKKKLITQFENYTKSLSKNTNLLNEMDFSRLLKDNCYECTICKKKLSTKGNLKVHMNIHTTNYKIDKLNKKYNFLESQFKMNDNQI